MQKLDSSLIPFTLDRQYRDYVWGGSKLRPGHVPTAEVWAVYETNTVTSGPHTGLTLSELVKEYGVNLLGSKVTARIGSRFPILVKLLDCNQWLSLQVHPDDRQAEVMEGKGQFGKTEAWYFLDVEKKAEILCGIKEGVSKTEIENSVQNGTILNNTDRISVKKGDYVLIPAGTIHALGPGLLVYEVQESSDITYRVFDWNRPASEGRKLHIDQSIRVINPDRHAAVQASPTGEAAHKILSCDYFQLEKIVTGNNPVYTELDGTTFHILTVICGESEIAGEGWSFDLAQYDSLVIPACTPDYTIKSSSGCEILRASA